MTHNSSNALCTSSDVHSIDSWPFDDLGGEAHFTLQHTAGRQVVSKVSGDATKNAWHGSQIMTTDDSANVWERLQHARHSKHSRGSSGSTIYHASFATHAGDQLFDKI